MAPLTWIAPSVDVEILYLCFRLIYGLGRDCVAVRAEVARMGPLELSCQSLFRSSQKLRLLWRPRMQRCLLPVHLTVNSVGC